MTALRTAILLAFAAGAFACGGGDGGSPTEPPASAGQVDPSTFTVLSINIPVGGVVRVGEPVIVRVRGTATGGPVRILASLRCNCALANSSQTVNGPFEVELTSTPRSVGVADANGAVGRISGIEFGQGANASTFYFHPHEISIFHVIDKIDIPVLPVTCSRGTAAVGSFTNTTLTYNTGDTNRSARLIFLTEGRFPANGSYPLVQVPSTGENQRVDVTASVSEPIETRFIQAQLFEGNRPGGIVVANSPQYSCRVRWQ